MRVLYGFTSLPKAILGFLSRATKSWDMYADHSRPAVSMGIDLFKKAMQDIKGIVESRNLPKIIYLIAES
ncbi:MAG: hypothetical protein M3Y53_09105 [Thermoproteota archaeon]|nr:hypothetical protein [Thermoproteota archaeon]